MIKTVDLTKKFGSFTAVDRLNLEIQPGEVFGFLGANGAGKTTAIRILCCLLRPSSGQAYVSGFDAVRQSDLVKKSIGYMSQKFALYNDLKVSENLEFYAGLYRIRRAQALPQARPYLQKLGLSPYIDSLVGSLPLGFKQRLALVCALEHDPRVVILDEPTSGVDPQARREFWAVIDSLAAEGRIVIVSTHYMDEAEYCHRVVVMQAGRAIAQGVPAELMAQYGFATMQQLFLHLAGQREQV